MFLWLICATCVKIPLFIKALSTIVPTAFTCRLSLWRGKWGISEQGEYTFMHAWHSHNWKSLGWWHWKKKKGTMMLGGMRINFKREEDRTVTPSSWCRWQIMAAQWRTCLLNKLAPLFLPLPTTLLLNLSRSLDPGIISLPVPLCYMLKILSLYFFILFLTLTWTILYYNFFTAITDKQGKMILFWVFCSPEHLPANYSSMDWLVKSVHLSTIAKVILLLHRSRRVSQMLFYQCVTSTPFLV